MGPKGKGKSPEGAIYCIGEFDGPVVFDGWDANGEPVGVPRNYPIVQVAAVSEEQDHNLYGPLREMLAESDLSADNGGHIDLGKTRVEFKDARPGKIEPVSASHGAREGQQLTAGALEETGLWFPSKGGRKLASTLRRNAAKTNGSTVEFTNPPSLGEGSVAEATMEAADKGTAGLLVDHAQGSYVEDYKNRDNRDAVMASLAEAYDDGSGTPVPWVTIDRLYDDLLDPDVTVDDGYRFFFGIARKREDRAFNIRTFDALGDDSGATRQWAEGGYESAALSPSTINEDTPVVLMFDGARTRDCAVFSAWTLGDDDTKPKHHHVASWSRPWHADGDYQHPRAEYRAVAREFIAAHRVVLFAYDSSFHELDSLYEDWSDEFGDYDPKSPGLMYEYPTATGKLMDGAIKQVTEDMRDGLLAHDANAVIREHISNAVLAKNNGGWLRLDKEKDSLKIDGAVTFTFGYDLLDLGRAIVAEGDTESVYEGRGLVTL